MSKIAVVVLADNENHGDLGRAVNALEVASEFKEAGDEVAIVFDGGGHQVGSYPRRPGSQAPRALDDGEKPGGRRLRLLRQGVRGEEGRRGCGVELLTDHNQHPSLRNYVERGFQIITF